jgi:hypothetical protein
LEDRRDVLGERHGFRRLGCQGDASNQESGAYRQGASSKPTRRPSVHRRAPFKLAFRAVEPCPFYAVETLPVRAWSAAQIVPV